MARLLTKQLVRKTFLIMIHAMYYTKKTSAFLRNAIMSTNKIEISPGQALLILIQHAQPVSERRIDLQTLYLTGVQNDDQWAHVESLFADPLLKDYHISYRKKCINDDATRRYFETHLAYETLKQKLLAIDQHALETYYQTLKTRAIHTNSIEPAEMNNILMTLDGKTTASNWIEYAHIISQINAQNMFKELSQEERDRLLLMTKISFLGVINAIYNDLPLDIYNQFPYTAAERGKKEHPPEQDSTTNQFLGLLKSYMPLPRDDIAYGNEVMPYLKPSDHSSFVEGAAFVEELFSQLFHPFSNSISGTLLCQLRSMADFLITDNGFFADSTEKIHLFLTLFISNLLFVSGGHSLNEFIAPLQLHATQEAFKSLPQFSTISLESMFYTHNYAAFYRALNDTLQYNNLILKQKRITSQIKQYTQHKTSMAEKELNLERINTKINTWKAEFIRTFSGRIKQYYEKSHKKLVAPNQKQISDLMYQSFEKIKHALQSNQTMQAIDEYKRLRLSVAHFNIKTLWGKKAEHIKILYGMEKEMLTLTAMEKEKTDIDGQATKLHF